MLARLEQEHYGVSFALYLRFELHLTLPKILEVTKSACKQYIRELDRYKAKIAYYHPYRKGVFIKVPRLAPTASKLTPIIRDIEATLGVVPGANGRVAQRPIKRIVNELLAQDPGHHGMPALSCYVGGELEVPLVFQWDATGFGMLQITTAAVRNPYHPQSAAQLRIFGLGNCDDGRGGSTGLMGEDNLSQINKWISCPDCDEFDVVGEMVAVKPKVWISTDVSCLRHTEHIAGAGWCCCSRDFALRTTPKKPADLEEMHTLFLKCHCPKRVERFIWSHSIVPGETRPRPCTAPGCTFAHGDAASALEELEGLLETERELASVLTKAG